MLGQNMDSDNDLPIKSKGKDISGVLPDTGYPLSSSFSLGTKKPSRQVRHLKVAINWCVRVISEYIPVEIVQN